MKGRTLGPYEIVEQIGKGGMGEVYLAQDTRLGRKVAIKVLAGRVRQRPRAAGALLAVRRELLQALNHPHIAAVHDVGHEDGIHFMVQEHLEGRTLREAIAEGRLPLKTGLKLALEIAEGLGAAHSRGHRASRPQARERVRQPRRSRQDSRLRPRQAHRDGGAARAMAAPACHRPFWAPSRAR